jgi:hypothetical protein
MISCSEKQLMQLLMAGANDEQIVDQGPVRTEQADCRLRESPIEARLLISWRKLSV